MAGSADTRSRLRLIVLQALVFSLFATLFARLYYLQVVSGADYQTQAASQSVREIVVQPQRGLIVDAQGRPGTPGTLTVLGAAGEPQRFRARIVITPWVPNLKLTFTKFAHPAYFLGGATTFTVLSDGTRTTLDEPGFVVTTRADGTRVGTFDYTIYSPAGNRSQCVHITFRTLFPGAPAAVAWLTKRMVSP